MSEIEDPSKEGTEIYYPDSDGPVKAGLPSDPSARPAGYADPSAKTGIDYGVAPDDLPESGRKTLGDWLVNRTSNNITPVAGGSHPADATPTINPVRSTSVLPGNAFVKSSEVTTVYSEENDINPAQMEYGPNGNANTYLRDYHRDGDATSQPAYLNPRTAGGERPALGKVLARNRFRPGVPFVGDGEDDRRWAAPQKFTSKGEIGHTLGEYNKDYDGLTVDELGRIAEHLMLNAVGDTETNFGSKGSATTNLGNQGSFGFQGILFTKTPTQLGGSTIDANQKFRAANALGVALSGDRTQTGNIAGTMATEDDPLAKNSTESFGVLNNHLEKFGAALPTSMIVLAAVAALTILVNVLIIALILDVLGMLAAISRGGFRNIGGGLNPPPTYHIYAGEGKLNADTATLPMGAAFGDEDFSELGFFDQLYKYLGIPPLDGSYPSFIPMVTASLFGVIEFFIGNSLNGGGGGSRVPQILTNAAGYYTVVTRNAIRDAQQITDAASEMDGGFVDQIEGFFSLIDAFRSSATFRFSMVMVTIGDKIVSGQGLTGNRDNGGVFGLPKNINGSEPMVISNLHKTVRMSPEKSRLSYSFTALPQVFIRPVENFTLPDRQDPKYASYLPSTRDQTTPRNNLVLDDVGNFNLHGWNAELASSDIITSDAVNVADSQGGLSSFQNRLSYFEGGRINTQFRKAMEAQLDTYYVPFYFHDLRTNEILPLPVFVEGISDSYSPKWSEVEGYGRADPVQIYGGTTRKIGMSFYMVATNDEDYSALYYGINKLVSMVYPQWGGAQQITNAKAQTFQVPYSYVPTASPLIRIRLGELFASNRAPENVRRLFGANLDGFKLGTLTTVDDLNNTAAADEQADADAQIAPDTADVIDYEAPNVESMDAVMKRANGEFRVDPTIAAVFIEATQLAALGSGPPLFNFCGADGNGEGGLTNDEGKSVLLPAGKVEIRCSAGRYRYVQWGGLSYNVVKEGRFFLPSGNDMMWEIVNYYADGYKAMSDRRGGYLKSTVYYVCRPVPGQMSASEVDKMAKKVAGDSAANGIGEVFVIIPVNKVTEIKVVNTPPTLIPNPFAPPPRVPVTDKSFFKDNLIVDAMQESGGRGIAGAITSLDFDWNQAPWETDPSLGRAPQYVKVTISFSPIHDEPLGLNPDGSLRAAAYPVGKVVEKVMGHRFAYPGDLPKTLNEEAAARFAALRAEALKINAQATTQGPPKST